MEVEETSSTTEAIECPVCAHFITDLWELTYDGGNEGDARTECPQCSTKLTINRAVSVLYRAKVRT